MRSAWSPARSRSFETFFVAFANRLLACPTDFAIDLASRSGRPFPIERGSVTPRTVLRRIRLLRTIPPAIPAAAAPAATAGPAALLATCLTVSATPPPLPLLLAVAGVLRRAVLRVVVLRFAPLLDARDALLDRVVRLLLLLRAGADFGRAGFLVPEAFRVDALAELLDRVLPLCGVLPAISNPLFRQ